MNKTIKYPLFHVDAFTHERFTGNPAAVVLCPTPLPDVLMQAIAAENNLSETAFVSPLSCNDCCNFHIRWFTPTMEVALCGHATLAAAHVLFAQHGDDWNSLCFHSLRGVLPVRRDGHWMTLSFPVDDVVVSSNTSRIAAALGQAPLELYRGVDDYLAIFANESNIANMQPNMQQLAACDDARGVIVSAIADKNQSYGIVSRFFAPQSGIPEDPVTGSAHCTLMPFWGKRLQCDTLHARQLSPRGGDVYCHLRGNTVELTGQAITFAEGVLYCP